MVAPYCPDRGDLIWLDFEPQSGREMKKRRPALVLTKRRFNAASGVCIVCPITSTIRGHPFEVALSTLEKPSVIQSANPSTLDWRTRKAKFIKKAPVSVVEEVAEIVISLIELA